MTMRMITTRCFVLNPILHTQMVVPILLYSLSILAVLCHSIRINPIVMHRKIIHCNQIVSQANRSTGHFSVRNVKWGSKQNIIYSGIASQQIANQKGAKIKRFVSSAQFVVVAFANKQHYTITKHKWERKSERKIGVLRKNIFKIKNRK